MAYIATVNLEKTSEGILEIDKPTDQDNFRNTSVSKIATEAS
jgi:hypothetical protein